MVDRKSREHECRNNKSQRAPSLFSLHAPARLLTHPFPSPVAFSITFPSLASLSLTSILYQTGNYGIRVIHANPSTKRAPNGLCIPQRGVRYLYSSPIDIFFVSPTHPPPSVNSPLSPLSRRHLRFSLILSHFPSYILLNYVATETLYAASSLFLFCGRGSVAELHSRWKTQETAAQVA